MPIVYRCRRCGTILYVFLRVGEGNYWGVYTPEEISNLYGGHCPRCGARLGKPNPEDVSILPFRRGGGIRELLHALEKRGTRTPLHTAPSQRVRAVESES